MRKKSTHKVGLATGIILLFALAAFSQGISKSRTTCRPEVVISSILDNVQVDRVLRLGPLRLGCAPVPERMTSKYVFEPYQGAKFTSRLKKSDGKIVNTFVWYGEKIFVDEVKLTHYEVVGGQNALQELAAGNYTLEFAIDEKVFQSFRFSVQTKKSRDVYRPGTIYLTEGPWRDEAVLSAGKLEDSIFFSFRLRADDELADSKPAAVPFELSISRDRDQLTVAEYRDAKLTLGQHWHSFRLYFYRPQRELSKDGSLVKLKELMAVDSGYTVKLSYNGKPYATYKFEVRNGKINGQELPARGIRITLPADILRR